MESQSPKFSDKWAQDNWHDPKAVKEHLEIAKNREDKEIICKMLGTCLKAACQYQKDSIKWKQELKTGLEIRKVTELLLSL